MKILFYTMTMEHGGTEKNITYLANKFSYDNNVFIVTNIKRPCSYKLNKNVEHICIDEIDKTNEFVLKKIISKTSYKRTKKLKKIFENIKPDVVIGMLPEPTIRLLSLKKYFKNIKFIISVRNHPNSEFKFIFKFIRNYYYKFADVIVLQTNKYIKYFNKSIKDKIVIIPNGIESNYLNGDYQKDKYKLVTVSRLVCQKNIVLLIKAFSLLDNKYKDYKLYIYGDGNEKNKLNKLIKKYNLNDQIFLMGDNDDIKNSIKDASVFLLSSNYEGMPNSLLEAMSLSIVPIVTNSSPAINELIIDGKNGFIVQKKNILAMKEKIEYLLDNPKLIKKIKMESYKTIINYDINKTYDLWKKVINK